MLKDNELFCDVCEEHLPDLLKRTPLVVDENYFCENCSKVVPSDDNLHNPYYILGWIEGALRSYHRGVLTQDEVLTQTEVALFMHEKRKEANRETNN